MLLLNDQYTITMPLLFGPSLTTWMIVGVALLIRFCVGLHSYSGLVSAAMLHEAVYWGVITTDHDVCRVLCRCT